MALLEIGGIAIPKGYAPLAKIPEGTPPERIRYIENGHEHGPFLFDPTDPDYQALMATCKADEKTIREALDLELRARRLPFRSKGCSNIRCLENQGLRKFLFLLRPPLFDPPPEVPRDDRAQQHRGNTCVGLHVDERGTYHLVRRWLHTHSPFAPQNQLLDDFAWRICSTLSTCRETISRHMADKELSDIASVIADAIHRAFSQTNVQSASYPDWFRVEQSGMEGGMRL